MSYTKQNFKSGDKLYASQLNAMDEQIFNSLLYTEQTLTEAQKAQARENIGAVSKDISLGLFTDGKYYIFVDGSPVGTGFEFSGNSGDVFGYVDENNNIVLNGNLADGTYSIKYETDDETIDIGNLVLDSNAYYTVTNTLTNCTNSNSATQAVKGESYSATITANDGFELKSVTVTMGGSPVSVSGGSISIAEVTGNIVIEAEAEEVQAAEPTNFAEPNTTNKTDWSIWCNDARFGSDGGYRAYTGQNNVVTNYVPMEVGDIIRFTGLNVPTTGTSMNQGLHFSDANKAMLSCSYLSFYTASNYEYLDVTVTDGVYEVDTSKLVNHDKAGASKYFRISGKLTGTVNDVVINVKRNGAWL